MAKTYITKSNIYPVQNINGLEIITQDSGNVFYAVIGSYDPIRASLDIQGATFIEADKPLVYVRRMDWSELTSRLNPNIVVGNCMVLRRSTKDGLLCGSDHEIGNNIFKTTQITEIKN